MEEYSVNPYESPMADWRDGAVTDAEQASSRPSYKLYSIWSIVLANILGVPVASGIVMAINYKRLGFSGKARLAVFWSVIVTLALFVLGIFITDDITIFALSVPELIGIYLIAKSFQGSVIEMHEAQGGRFASAWIAAGIGLLCLIAIILVYCLIAFTLGE
jgi:hypothetical protein